MVQPKGQIVCKIAKNGERIEHPIAALGVRENHAS
jgi:hypothetical protein